MSNAVSTASDYFKKMKSTAAPPTTNAVSTAPTPATKPVKQSEFMKAYDDAVKRAAEAREEEQAARPPTPTYRIDVTQALSLADFCPITAMAPQLGSTTARATAELQRLGRGESAGLEASSFEYERKPIVSELWRGDQLLASIDLFGAVTLQRQPINARTGIDLTKLTDDDIRDHMPTIAANGQVIASKALQRPLDAPDPTPIDRAQDGRMDEFEMLDAMRAQDGDLSGPSLAAHRLTVLTGLFGGDVTVKQFDPLSGKSATGETPTDPFAGPRAQLSRVRSALAAARPSDI